MKSRAKRKSSQGSTLKLESLEARNLLAADVVMFNDVGPGAGSSANATSYVADDTASGLLKNVETGEETGITLSTSHVGAAFGNGGNTPLGETDLIDIFDGFVDFGSTTRSLIEISGDDTYTSTFSGLDPVNLYDVAATAIRGNQVYFNRWSLFTLEGADSYMAAHSDGNGIVTTGLEDNQVAIWTGSNYLEDQGFVAQWHDIDPGADGEFSIVAEQYKGATPGVGNGTANGLAGYAPSGIRLVEHNFDAPSVSNTEADFVLATSAVIGGEVIDTGGLASELKVYWGSTDGGTDPANWDSSVDFGPVGVGQYDELITGLTSETAYYYRAFASNEAGGAWASESAVFATSALTLPTVTADPVTEVGAFSANVSGRVVDAGGEPPLLSIYYGTTDGGTNTGDWENLIGIGERLDDFSAGLAGLSPETEYFFRVRATNGAGSTWSSETLSFVTGDTPLIAISEFMSQNNSTLTTRTRTMPTSPFTGEDDTPDWIEIRNLSGGELNISGMHLTDNQGDPNQWQFPNGTTIPAGGYLVVLASGKDIVDPRLDEKGYLHTNFSLSSGGEYVALTDAEGGVIDEYRSVPTQAADISYGRANDAPRYFSEATPGETNSNSFIGLVADTSFSVDRGFYDAPFDVEITSATEGATIRYTLDGSEPSETNGLVYNGPIAISQTSTLRAIAFKPGMQSTNVDTQTYLFLDDVIQQTPASTIAAGFPSSWKGESPDYGMDPDVIGPNDDFGGRYAETIQDDLKSLPTLSIVGDIDDLFGTNGVYTNPNSSTIEKPISFEMITADGSEEFQINAGVKIQGGAFRSWGLTKKKSLRVKFKTAYGPAKLKYPLFGEDAAQEFDTLTLRMEANDGWQWNGAGNQPQFARDEFGRRTQLAMGQPASHGRFVHVYLNGVYWGMYDMVERPDQSFGESYVGGDKDDWDGLNSGTPINADDAARRNRASAAWNELVSLSRDVANADTEAERTAAFMKVQGKNPDGSNNPAWESYVDVENMIDYFIVNWYAANSDWPHKNYYVGRENGPDTEGFQFFMWDAEWSLFLRSNLTTNKVNDGAGVAAPIQQLRASEEFRLMFADRVQKHLVNPGGPLYVDPENPNWDPDHPERNVPASTYAGISAENFNGIVAESARWGDQHRSAPYTRDNEYVNEFNHIMEDWFPERSEIFLDQLVAGELYPSVHAPVFKINGVDQHGGAITSGDALTMTAAASIVTTESTLVALDAPVQAFIATDDSLETGAGPRWYDPDFDSASWTSGTNGVGFGSDYGDFVGTDIQTEWVSTPGDKSLYTRYEFDLDAGFDMSQVDRLQVNTKFDDGYAVFLNGQLVHRTNTPDPLAWNSTATSKRLNLLNKLPTVFERTDISEHRGLLRPGKNVLAIQVLNHATDAGDLLMFAELLMEDDMEVLAPIVYTLDGTDPRVMGGDSVGISYDGQIPLTETTTVKARALVFGQWSALNEVTFVANPVASGDIVISEINYNPADATPSELTQIGTLDNDDFEFVEMLNRGSDTVDLRGARFTNGIDFEFPEYDLAAGERVVIVRDLEAFQVRYGTDVEVLGEFSDGSLNNGGERIAISDQAGNVIVDFAYDDADVWPQSPDGVGGTLELIATSTPNDELGKYYRWRGSVDFGGSPGTDGSDSVGVVVNEVLANSDVVPDAIELLNVTDAEISIGGWYLSDAGGDLLKYQIPAGTLLAAGEAMVFDESHFNPTPLTPGARDFALSGSGDDVYVVIDDGLGNVRTIVDDVHFGSTRDDQSLGRIPDGLGRLAPLQRSTLGCTNVGHQIADLIISEVNYNPGEPTAAALAIAPDLTSGDLEFVEIHNPGLQDLDLTEWRIRGGVDFNFAAGSSIASGETIVIVRFDPLTPANADRLSAFRTHYEVANARIEGGLSGQLSANGERIVLQGPDVSIDQPEVTNHTYVDQVVYDNLAPWSISANGQGDSLHRRAAILHGDAASSWSGESPTPGSVDEPAGIAGDLNDDGQVDVRDIDTMAAAVASESQSMRLDVDGNGIVNREDTTFLVQDILGWRMGDANLDGMVDAADLNEVGLNWQKSGCVSWERGDFNGDNRVGPADLNFVGLNWGQVAAAAPGIAQMVGADGDIAEPANANVDSPIASDEAIDVAAVENRPTRLNQSRSIQRRDRGAVDALNRSNDREFAELIDELFAQGF